MNGYSVIESNNIRTSFILKVLPIELKIVLVIKQKTEKNTMKIIIIKDQKYL